MFKKATSPFHDGEKQVQERLGTRSVEAWAHKMIREFFPDQHREFYANLPFLVLSARDKAGLPWITVVEGPVGFASSPTRTELNIQAYPVKGDALEGCFTEGADIGLIGIELATRRRNRAGGRVANPQENGFTFALDHSFGNCPQYIHERDWEIVAEKPEIQASRGTSLTGQQQNWIANSDTFFIGSGYRGDDDNFAYGMDASHRGGLRGFVDIQSPNKLVFPDYPGNNLFNTLGNIEKDPRAGLVFVDFATGSLLQLSGRVNVDWDSQEFRKIPGALRLIEFEIDHVVEVQSALHVRWKRNPDLFRRIKVVDKIKESENVTSFIFEADDGGSLDAFEAGQHLPIEFRLGEDPQNVKRTYTISSSPYKKAYRISIKREENGLASNVMHDYVEPGMALASYAPAGDFKLSRPDMHQDKPLILLSAGIGVTPMISMLSALVAENADRSVSFIHAARDGAHHPFAKEVKALIEGAGKTKIDAHIAYSQPRAEDQLGQDFDSTGRLSFDQLTKALSSIGDMQEAVCYLCGPINFMAEMQTNLEKLGMKEENIHTETFG